MRYKLSGYMTIEASYIVPSVFMCFILIILYTFYLYNHMVAYQSCYQAALRGSQLKNTGTDAIEEYVDREAAKLLDEQVYQYDIDRDVRVSLTSVEVGVKTHVDNIVQRFGIYDEKQLADSRLASAVRIDPSDYIRNLHRFE